MANVTEWVKKIREAIYGKDVRESIASSIEAMNEQCEESVAGYQQAIENAESAVVAANSAVTQADAAASAANAAADRANKAAEAIEGTDVGDLAVRVHDLEGEMDTVNGKIDGLNVPQMQQSITQLESEMDTAQQDIIQLQTDVSSKVDKETGKGLSSNDYTAADKAKVDAAPSYAEYQLTLASGLTGELHGYRIGNLCRIVGVVTGIKTTATDICSDLPDDLILSSGSVPAVLNPSISIANSLGYTLSVYKRALNGDRVLQGSIGKGFASTDPIVNLPCYIDISYSASL